ncbi:tigger transposable element-derived protein 1 [Trichonephila clavipes]|uniref:Tigger transposable element-derived protein 1 n=1 Tax=Trichonephila clavipes TaxID=2585209 RepID=A0A8X6T350_TRICX|nr:tigger transposable element-derived protein 1 [Trichonephila clavipes]
MKALKFYKELKESEPSTSSRESNPQFSASTGWLTGFIKRHSFHNLKIKGEVASADEEAARKYPEKLAKIIKDGEYCAHQVFNADETGLFLEKMPTRTYIAKSEKTASGFKAAKDRVTLLLCSNASGDRMLKPLLVNRSLKPPIAEIKSQTLNACWKAAWPECVSKGNESNRAIVTSEIISIAKEIGGEGFDDFGEHDIEELLVDEALNDDDILESMVDITKDLETVDSEPEEDVTPLDEKLLREGLQLSVPEEALPCRSDDVILSSSDESDLAPIHKRVEDSHLITDHKPLIAIFGSKRGLPVLAATRLLHYALILQSFEFDIIFRKTIEHGNADFLSRLPKTSEELEVKDDITIFQMSQIEALPVTSKELRQETSKDIELGPLLRALREGKDLQGREAHSIPLRMVVLCTDKGSVFQGNFGRTFWKNYMLDT